MQDLVDSRQYFESLIVDAEVPAGLEVRLGVAVATVGGRDVMAEVYAPTKPLPEPRATILSLHGGGWCTGSARSDRAVAMGVAAAGATVVNLEYSLAPEHPWPRALLDVLATIAAIRSDDVPGVPGVGRLALMGFSAGANLAAAATCAILGDPLPEIGGTSSHLAEPPDALALIYGIFDWPRLTAADLTIRDSVALWNRAYLGETFLRNQRDPLVSPRRSTRLGSFPPVFAMCGSRDELLPQSLDLVLALADAGAPVHLSVVDGVDHGFVKREAGHVGGRQEFLRLVEWCVASTAAAVSQRGPRYDR